MFVRILYSTITINQTTKLKVWDAGAMKGTKNTGNDNNADKDENCEPTGKYFDLRTKMSFI